MGRPKRWCEVDACGRDSVGWGMCRMHYQRWRTWGDPTKVGSRWTASAHDRFWQYVDKSGDCWRWTGSLKYGYGTFSVSDGDGGDRMVQAHRYAYEDAVGPIPEGITLDHLCHTRVAVDCPTSKDCPHRACVRPDHMEMVPLRDNIQRGGNGVKTHCKRGHEFTEENTYHMPRGGRSCRACQAMRRAGLLPKRTA